MQTTPAARNHILMHANDSLALNRLRLLPACEHAMWTCYVLYVDLKDTDDRTLLSYTTDGGAIHAINHMEVVVGEGCDMKFSLWDLE